MSVPAVVTPPDEHLRGDAWTFTILLDTNKNWSASTFTIDTSPIDGYQMVLDVSQKGASPPSIALSLSADATTHITSNNVRWNLAENLIIGRTFLTGNVYLVDRFSS